MTSRVIFLAAMTVVLSSCGSFDKTQNHTSDCTWRERDLTVAWEQREYWCVPDTVRTRARVTSAGNSNK